MSMEEVPVAQESGPLDFTGDSLQILQAIRDYSGPEKYQRGWWLGLERTLPDGTGYELVRAILRATRSQMYDGKEMKDVLDDEINSMIEREMAQQEIDVTDNTKSMQRKADKKAHEKPKTVENGPTLNQKIKAALGNTSVKGGRKQWSNEHNRPRI